MGREVRGVCFKREVDGGVDCLEEVPVRALIGLRDVFGEAEGLEVERLFGLALQEAHLPQQSHRKLLTIMTSTSHHNHIQSTH